MAPNHGRELPHVRAASYYHFKTVLAGSLLPSYYDKKYFRSLDSLATDNKLSSGNYSPSPRPFVSQTLYNNSVEFARPMHASDEDLFDIRRAARPGDQDHRAGLLGWFWYRRQQLIQVREYPRLRDNGHVHRREQRNQARFGGAGQHHQSAGFGQRIIGARNPDIRARTAIAQGFAVRKSGSNLLESNDAAAFQERRVRGDRVLTSQEFT